MLLGLSDLLPSSRNGADPRGGRAKRVSEGYVLLVGEYLLHGSEVSFEELICR
jgi:hypothetical protein